MYSKRINIIKLSKEANAIVLNFAVFMVAKSRVKVTWNTIYTINIRATKSETFFK